LNELTDFGMILRVLSSRRHGMIERDCQPFRMFDFAHAMIVDVSPMSAMATISRHLRSWREQSHILNGWHHARSCRACADDSARRIMRESVNSSKSRV